MKAMFSLVAALLITTVFPIASDASPDNNCLDCHGSENATGYVDRNLFKGSSHGIFSCTACHIDVTGYPHERVSSVKCGICHYLGRADAPVETAREYQMSVHGLAVRAGEKNAPSCQTCHGSHYIFPSTDELSNTTRKKIPFLCSKCHKQEYMDYHKSIHGKAFIEKKNIGAATCFDCHLEHLTPRVEEERWKLALIKECGTCHRREMDTYRETYHGKVTGLGYSTAAKCSDCHGSHKILPPDVEASTLSKQYILYTCRKCHPDATERFTRFYAHPDVHDRKGYPVLYYTYLFMTLLLLGVFSFFFIHTFLWTYRSLNERHRIEKEGG